MNKKPVTKAKPNATPEKQANNTYFLGKPNLFIAMHKVRDPGIYHYNDYQNTQTFEDLPQIVRKRHSPLTETMYLVGACRGSIHTVTRSYFYARTVRDLVKIPKARYHYISWIISHLRLKPTQKQLEKQIVAFRKAYKKINKKYKKQSNNKYTQIHPNLLRGRVATAAKWLGKQLSQTRQPSFINTIDYYVDNLLFKSSNNWPTKEKIAVQNKLTQAIFPASIIPANLIPTKSNVRGLHI